MEEKLAAHRAALERLAKAGEPDLGEKDPVLCRRYAPDRLEGKAIYESYTDEMLLELLREKARELGRSPAQREIFWVYRAYLRARFRNWPTALRMAGLSTSAGQGGQTLEQAARQQTEQEKLLEQVREAAAALGRMPHPKDLPEAAQGLKKRYKTWSEVLDAAGAREAAIRSLHLIEDLEPEYRRMLGDLRRQAEELGRAPLIREVEPEVRTALAGRCGSWRNALYQIGLEPVQRIAPFSNTGLTGRKEKSAHHRQTLHDCYYRVLRLDDQTRRELELVRETAELLGRVPDRRDVPPEIRRHLQQVCGSWANALFQIGIRQKGDHRR